MRAKHAPEKFFIGLYRDFKDAVSICRYRPNDLSWLGMFWLHFKINRGWKVNLVKDQGEQQIGTENKMSNPLSNELQIYDEKGNLDDVGLRFNRTEAKAASRRVERTRRSRRKGSSSENQSRRCVISRVYGGVQEESEMTNIPHYARYNREKCPTYVEPTPKELEIAYQTGKRLIAEREASNWQATKSPNMPNAGWNFGGGTSGVIE